MSEDNIRIGRDGVPVTIEPVTIEPLVKTIPIGVSNITVPPIDDENIKEVEDTVTEPILLNISSNTDEKILVQKKILLKDNTPIVDEEVITSTDIDTQQNNNTLADYTDDIAETTQAQVDSLMLVKNDNQAIISKNQATVERVQHNIVVAEALASTTTAINTESITSVIDELSQVSSQGEPFNREYYLSIIKDNKDIKINNAIEMGVYDDNVRDQINKEAGILEAGVLQDSYNFEGVNNYISTYDGDGVKRNSQQYILIESMLQGMTNQANGSNIKEIGNRKIKNFLTEGNVKELTGFDVGLKTPISVIKAMDGYKEMTFNDYLKNTNSNLILATDALVDANNKSNNAITRIENDATGFDKNVLKITQETSTINYQRLLIDKKTNNDKQEVITNKDRFDKIIEDSTVNNVINRTTVRAKLNSIYESDKADRLYNVLFTNSDIDFKVIGGDGKSTSIDVELLNGGITRKAGGTGMKNLYSNETFAKVNSVMQGYAGEEINDDNVSSYLNSLERVGISPNQISVFNNLGGLYGKNNTAGVFTPYSKVEEFPTSFNTNKPNEVEVYQYDVSNTQYYKNHSKTNKIQGWYDEDDLEVNQDTTKLIDKSITDTMLVQRRVSEALIKIDTAKQINTLADITTDIIEGNLSIDEANKRSGVRTERDTKADELGFIKQIGSGLVGGYKGTNISYAYSANPVRTTTSALLVTGGVIAQAVPILGTGVGAMMIGAGIGGSLSPTFSSMEANTKFGEAVTEKMVGEDKKLPMGEKVAILAKTDKLMLDKIVNASAIGGDAWFVADTILSASPLGTLRNIGMNIVANASMESILSSNEKANPAGVPLDVKSVILSAVVGSTVDLAGAGAGSLFRKKKNGTPKDDIGKFEDKFNTSDKFTETQTQTEINYEVDQLKKNATVKEELQTVQEIVESSQFKDIPDDVGEYFTDIKGTNIVTTILKGKDKTGVSITKDEFIDKHLKGNKGDKVSFKKALEVEIDIPKGYIDDIKDMVGELQAIENTQINNALTKLHKSLTTGRVTDTTIKQIDDISIANELNTDDIIRGKIDTLLSGIKDNVGKRTNDLVGANSKLRTNTENSYPLTHNGEKTTKGELEVAKANTEKNITDGDVEFGVGTDSTIIVNTIVPEAEKVKLDTTAILKTNKEEMAKLKSDNTTTVIPTKLAIITTKLTKVTKNKEIQSKKISDVSNKVNDYNLKDVDIKDDTSIEGITKTKEVLEAKIKTLRKTMGEYIPEDATNGGVNSEKNIANLEKTIADANAIKNTNNERGKVTPTTVLKEADNTIKLLKSIIDDKTKLDKTKLDISVLEDAQVLSQTKSDLDNTISASDKIIKENDSLVKTHNTYIKSKEDLKTINEALSNIDEVDFIKYVDDTLEKQKTYHNNQRTIENVLSLVTKKIDNIYSIDGVLNITPANRISMVTKLRTTLVLGENQGTVEVIAKRLGYKNIQSLLNEDLPTDGLTNQTLKNNIEILLDAEGRGNVDPDNVISAKETLEDNLNKFKASKVKPNNDLIAIINNLALPLGVKKHIVNDIKDNKNISSSSLKILDTIMSTDYFKRLVDLPVKDLKKEIILKQAYANMGVKDFAGFKAKIDKSIKAKQQNVKDFNKANEKVKEEVRKDAEDVLSKQKEHGADKFNEELKGTVDDLDTNGAITKLGKFLYSIRNNKFFGGILGTNNDEIIKAGNAIDNLVYLNNETSLGVANKYNDLRKANESVFKEHESKFYNYLTAQNDNEALVVLTGHLAEVDKNTTAEIIRVLHAKKQVINKAGLETYDLMVKNAKANITATKKLIGKTYKDEDITLNGKVVQLKELTDGETIAIYKDLPILKKLKTNGYLTTMYLSNANHEVWLKIYGKNGRGEAGSEARELYEEAVASKINALAKTTKKIGVVFKMQRRTGKGTHTFDLKTGKLTYKIYTNADGSIIIPTDKDGVATNLGSLTKEAKVYIKETIVGGTNALKNLVSPKNQTPVLTIKEYNNSNAFFSKQKVSQEVKDYLGEIKKPELLFGATRASQTSRQKAMFAEDWIATTLVPSGLVSTEFNATTHPHKINLDTKFLKDDTGIAVGKTDYYASFAHADAITAKFATYQRNKTFSAIAYTLAIPQKAYVTFNHRVWLNAIYSNLIDFTVLSSKRAYTNPKSVFRGLANTFNVKEKNIRNLNNVIDETTTQRITDEDFTKAIVSAGALHNSLGTLFVNTNISTLARGGVIFGDELTLPGTVGVLGNASDLAKKVGHGLNTIPTEVFNTSDRYRRVAMAIEYVEQYLGQGMSLAKATNEASVRVGDRTLRMNTTGVFGRTLDQVPMLGVFRKVFVESVRMGTTLIIKGTQKAIKAKTDKVNGKRWAKESLDDLTDGGIILAKSFYAGKKAYAVGLIAMYGAENVRQIEDDEERKVILASSNAEFYEWNSKNDFYEITNRITGHTSIEAVDSSYVDNQFVVGLVMKTAHDIYSGVTPLAEGATQIINETILAPVGTRIGYDIISKQIKHYQKLGESGNTDVLDKLLNTSAKVVGSLPVTKLTEDGTALLKGNTNRNGDEILTKKDILAFVGLKSQAFDATTFDNNQTKKLYKEVVLFGKDIIRKSYLYKYDRGFEDDDGSLKGGNIEEVNALVANYINLQVNNRNKLIISVDRIKELRDMEIPYGEEKGIKLYISNRAERYDKANKDLPPMFRRWLGTPTLTADSFEKLNRSKGNNTLVEYDNGEYKILDSNIQKQFDRLASEPNKQQQMLNKALIFQKAYGVGIRKVITSNGF